MRRRITVFGVCCALAAALLLVNIAGALWVVAKLN